MIPLNISDMLNIIQNDFTMKKSIISFMTGNMLRYRIVHDSVPIVKSILRLLFDLFKFVIVKALLVQSSSKEVLLHRVSKTFHREEDFPTTQMVL